MPVKFGVSGSQVTVLPVEMGRFRDMDHRVACKSVASVWESGPRVACRNVASLRNRSPGCLLNQRVACKSVASPGVGVTVLPVRNVASLRNGSPGVPVWVSVLPAKVWRHWELGQCVACKSVASLGVGSVCCL